MEPMTQNKAGQRTGTQSQTRDSGSDSKGSSFATNAANKASELAQEVGSAIANKASDLAQTASSSMTKKADHVAAATGRGIEQMADSLRRHTPDSGVVGSASNALADSLESGGKYLEEHGMKAMCDGLTTVVRSNPMTSIAIAAGVGFLLARATTCRNA